MDDHAPCHEKPSGRFAPIESKVVERRPFGEQAKVPIRLQLGEHPWRPTPDTDVVELYGRQDRPNAGLIEQNGRLYVFDCVKNHGTGVSFWTYTWVDAADVSRLRDAVGDELIHVPDQIFASRPTVAALVMYDRIDDPLIEC